MKNTIIIKAAIILSIILPYHAIAQKPEIVKRNSIENYPKYTIAWQPFHMFDGKLKLDFEKQLNSPKNWLQISLSGSYLSMKAPLYNSYSWSTFQSNFDDFSKLNGFGGGIAYKSIFYSTCFYYSIGVNYAHNRVRYYDYDYFPYIEDDLSFYEYRKNLQRQIFNKLSTSICLGIQSNLNRTFFFDVYLGFGYSHSFYDESKRAFDDESLGFGYRGVFPSGGVRLGITFGR